MESLRVEMTVFSKASHSEYRTAVEKASRKAAWLDEQTAGKWGDRLVSLSVLT